MAAAGPAGPGGEQGSGAGTHEVGGPSYPTRHKRDLKQKKLTKRLTKKTARKQK